MERDIYAGELKLYGEENERPLISANNLVVTLNDLKRFEEAKSLMRKTIPVARRVLKDGDELTLMMRSNYAKALYADANATLDDLREAVKVLEDVERTARRMLGGAHPTTAAIERYLCASRDSLYARGLP